MALTNRERQARYRDKLKAAAAAAGGGESRHREAVRALYREMRAAYTREGMDCTPHGFVLELLPQEMDYRDVMAAIILDLLDLPADPWPGLTYAELAQMIGKRKREASQRKLRFGTSTEEVNMEEKIRAAHHRAWLLAGPCEPKRASAGRVGSQMVADEQISAGAGSETTS